MGLHRGVDGWGQDLEGSLGDVGQEDSTALVAIDMVDVVPEQAAISLGEDKQRAFPQLHSQHTSILKAFTSRLTVLNVRYFVFIYICCAEQTNVVYTLTKPVNTAVGAVLEKCYQRTMTYYGLF